MPDFTVGETLYKRFTTRAFATGIPGTLGGAPVVSAYEDDSITQITAGITLGVDHDSVTGLNLLTIIATGANGFEAGKSYDFVITTGTVAGVSVVGEVVWHFTLGAEAAFTRIGAAGASLTDLGGMSTGMKGEVNAEADTALTDYDAPTNAEMVARTLPAAAYFDPAVDTVANVTTVATLNGHTAQTGDSFARIGATGSGLTSLAQASLVTAARMGALTDLIDGGRLDLIFDIIAVDVAGIDGVAPALASVVTETRMSELDAATAGKMANQVDEIRTDTGEIGAAGAGLTNINLPNQTMDITGNLSGSVGSVTGAVGSVTGAVGSVTGNVGGSVASVTGAVGSVTGAVGSLTGHTVQTGDSYAALTDARAEPAQGAPPVNPSFLVKGDYQYKAWRNKTDNDGATTQLYADDTLTVDHKQTTSEAAGTVTKGEWVSGA